MTDLTISRLALFRNDEDCTGSVCLLLPDGHATLIDAALFEWAIRFDWKVVGRSIFYAEYIPASVMVLQWYGTRKQRKRYPPRTVMYAIHREIMRQVGVNGLNSYQLGVKMLKRDVDHRNRNPWDNRGVNLRLATRSQNAHNTAPTQNKSSQYKGVSRVKGKDKWTAQIKVKGKLYYLGTFDDEFKAAQAYNAAVRKHCPEFGYINPLSISHSDR